MEERLLLTETYERIVRERLPNLFRLYLNPYVVQACFCLERYAQELSAGKSEPFQSFLANSFDEALSGAIKLARYDASKKGKPATGLIIDPENQLGPLVSAQASNQRVEFLPGFEVVSDKNQLPPARGFGLVVLMPRALPWVDQRLREAIGQSVIIACVDRRSLANPPTIRGFSPDIFVFDESFVRREVPFGAFAARQALYAHWNRSGKSTFHSTTFQPNTISSSHFLRCLECDDPKLHAAIADELRLIETDPATRKSLFRRLYSPSLAGAIAAAGFDKVDVRAAGDFVTAGEIKVLDGVSGVACSVRGHNPPAYVEEIEALANVDVKAEIARRLFDLTGLAEVVPAVSGASAVEVALKIGLVAQYPRRRVLAFKSGFGGKTLFALTGTWKDSYKLHIDPLYPHVSYIDPFAPDAIAQIDEALATQDIAVAQTELIQGVGGVRRVPEAVLRHLAATREKHGHLLLIDEVQTGMYRTGPFALSKAMGLSPDLLVVGKAISDMMVPFALALYSEGVQARLDTAGSDLPAFFRTRHDYALGYKTALNVLRFAERTCLAERVAQSGALFERLLKEELAGCKAVREIRAFGMLIGIELEDRRWPQSWFKKRLFWFYLAGLLRHARYPVLAGFCQYEPNILKITPSLTASESEIRSVCATLGDVLRRPFYQLLTSALGGFLRSIRPWRNRHDRAVVQAHEPVSR